MDNARRTGPSPLKEIAAKDPNVKIIVNTCNFGHVRSPYYGMLQGFGDAVIYIVADLQDPPSLFIREFLAKWEEGYPMVLGIKKGAKNPQFLCGPEVLLQSCKPSLGCGFD